LATARAVAIRTPWIGALAIAASAEAQVSQTDRVAVNKPDLPPYSILLVRIRA